MDALHENIAQYTHSGSKPCNMAATGEYVLGISFEYAATTNKAKARDRLVFEGRPGWTWKPSRSMLARRSWMRRKSSPIGSSKDAMKLYARTSRSPRSPAWPSR